MYKVKQTVSMVLIAMAMGVQAQTPAKELVKNNPITQLERGQSIDVYGDYTVVGSTMGLGSPLGAGMLFYQNQHVRDYFETSGADGLGVINTVGIDQHALVLGFPGHTVNGVTKGRVAIFNKTWNGTHYSPTVSQQFIESTTGTGFGAAVGISDNWIIVGAPTRNVDGGVKLYFRNPGTGVWEDKGWLPMPNLESAPFRYRSFGGPLIKWNASFGNTLSILHNNLIVGAPGIGSFYIYQFNGTSWVYTAQYQGTNDVGHTVAISDEYAATSTSGLLIETFKKSWNASNPWPFLQVINTTSPVNSLATENNKLIVGLPSGGPNFKGEVAYFEIRSHQVGNTNVWVNDFVKVGKMLVSPAASPNGLIAHNRLGHSVAIHANTVVAGDPNAQYTGSADGAGFKGDFNQYAPAREEGEEEVVTMAAAYLFPNPATDVVNVSTQNEIVSAVAINALGAKVNLPVVGNQAMTRGLTAGLYTISIATNEGNITEKVVIK